MDLLIEADQRLIPVECKWKERPGPADASGIRHLRALYGAAVTEGYVACTTSSAFRVTAGVTAVRGWRVWPTASRDAATAMTPPAADGPTS